MAPKRKHDPGYKLPEIIEPDENCCICIPIPNDFNHKMAFLGQLDELGYWWNWERDPLKQGKDAAAVWRKIVACIREDLDMSGCGCGGNDRGEPTNQRYTEDGHLEVSYDNGETWENGDGFDPRFNSIVYPPYSGAGGNAERCKGANSIVSFIEAEQAKSSAILGAAGGATELAAAIATGIVGTGVGIVAGIVVAIMGFVLRAIAGAGQAAFDAGFTTLFYDELLCVLYCNIESDGTITEAGWQAIIEETNALGFYPAGEWTAYMIKTMGLVGANNASLSGNIGTASCDGCGCENLCLDTSRILIGTLVSITPTEIVIQAELTTFLGTTAYWAMYGSETDDYCCLICTMTADPGFTSAGWTDCDGNPQNTTSPNGEMVRNVLGYRNGETYQMTITIQDDCPE